MNGASEDTQLDDAAAARAALPAELITAMATAVATIASPGRPVIGIKMVEPAQPALVQGERRGRIRVDAVAGARPAHWVTVIVAIGFGGLPPHPIGTGSRYWTVSGLHTQVLGIIPA